MVVKEKFAAKIKAMEEIHEKREIDRDRESDERQRQTHRET